MERLKEHIAQMNSILDIELTNLKTFNEEQIRIIKNRYGINWEPETIYYNKTNLVFMETLEHGRITGVERKLKNILSIHIADFNVYIHVVSYTECTYFNELLGEGEPKSE